jgi:hypothetical protein
MKRFDLVGSKLSNNIDFPKNFSFDQEYMNAELAKKEQNGYLELDKNENFPFNRNSFESTATSQPEDYPKVHNYELISMIIHHGYSASRGHYYSLIKVHDQTPT